ncbi:hypothetical protein [Micromonospora sp. NPDC049645]|uniref:hypothetical protein n=1 Tax=Micromonospora sp. NPDC049645 TaxID=3155508 RepID=UPI00342FC8E8
MTTTTTTTTAARFTNSQRAAIIVCAPARLAPGMLAHKVAHHSIGTDTDGSPSGGGRLVFTADRRWVIAAACQPAPDPADPHTGRGWAEYSAGWADHMGALACPACFPPEGI